MCETELKKVTIRGAGKAHRAFLRRATEDTEMTYQHEIVWIIHTGIDFFLICSVAFLAATLAFALNVLIDTD
jgi:hypothetical protein